MKFGYVIGPFRAATTWGIAKNVHNAALVGAELIALGVFPVIPHKNTDVFHGTSSDEFWIEGTKLLMERTADFAITVEALGLPWKHSAGSVGEVEHMLHLNRPVFHSLRPLRAWLEHEENRERYIAFQLKP